MIGTDTATVCALRPSVPLLLLLSLFRVLACWLLLVFVLLVLVLVLVQATIAIAAALACGLYRT